MSGRSLSRRIGIECCHIEVLERLQIQRPPLHQHCPLFPKIGALVGLHRLGPDNVTDTHFGHVMGRVRRLCQPDAPLRANKRETFDWLKFTLEGEGERTHGYAFTDTAFARYRV